MADRKHKDMPKPPATPDVEPPPDTPEVLPQAPPAPPVPPVPPVPPADSPGDAVPVVEPLEDGPLSDGTPEPIDTDMRPADDPQPAEADFVLDEPEEEAAAVVQQDPEPTLQDSRNVLPEAADTPDDPDAADVPEIPEPGQNADEPEPIEPDADAAGEVQPLDEPAEAAADVVQQDLEPPAIPGAAANDSDDALAPDQDPDIPFDHMDYEEPDQPDAGDVPHEDAAGAAIEELAEPGQNAAAPEPIEPGEAAAGGVEPMDVPDDGTIPDDVPEVHPASTKLPLVGLEPGSVDVGAVDAPDAAFEAAPDADPDVPFDHMDYEEPVRPELAELDALDDDAPSTQPPMVDMEPGSVDVGAVDALEVADPDVPFDHMDYEEPVPTDAGDVPQIDQEAITDTGDETTPDPGPAPQAQPDEQPAMVPPIPEAGDDSEVATPDATAADEHPIVAEQPTLPPEPVQELEAPAEQGGEQPDAPPPEAPREATPEAAPEAAPEVAPESPSALSQDPSDVPSDAIPSVALDGDAYAAMTDGEKLDAILAALADLPRRIAEELRLG